MLSWLLKWSLWCFMKSFQFQLSGILKLANLGVKHKLLPPMEDKLLLQNATSLAKDIRTGKVKCLQVVEAYISRIQAVNPMLNAVVDERFRAALKEARKVDELIVSGVKTEEQLARETPLLGIPLTVKESIPVQGLSNNAGRTRPESSVATKDAEVVRMLREAGAIVLCVSNTPELCFSWETDNYVTGRTNNPYDTRCTPAGSSGGEGALLGSGASVIGLGSDIAGSGRLPAFFCGVFGHKPTPDVVLCEEHIPTSDDAQWTSYFSLAPMCRYAADLPLFLKCLITNPDVRPKLKLDDPVDLSKIKIFYMEEDGAIMSNGVHPEIKGCIRKAVEHFSNKYSIKTEKVKLKELDDTFSVAVTLLANLTPANSVYQKSFEDKNEWNGVTKIFLKWFICQSPHKLHALSYGPFKKYTEWLSDSEVHSYMEAKKHLMALFNEMLGEDGVFFYPTFNSVAHRHCMIYSLPFNTAYPLLFNLLEMPATACATGLSKDGLPLGFQVAATKYQDRLCLAVARELEEAFGGWVPPPSSELIIAPTIKVED